MKLSDHYLGELHIAAGEYVDAVEDFLLLHCKFGAAVDCFKRMHHVESVKLKSLMDRCDRCLKTIEAKLQYLPRTSLITRHKLNTDLRDMRKLNVPAEFKKMTDMMLQSRGLSFTDQFVSGINIHWNNMPKNSFQSARFKKFQMHETDFTIIFQNGRKLTWHTLQEGSHLNAARKTYDHIAKSLHVDISRSSHRSASRHKIS